MKIKAGICQLMVTEDKAANLKKAEHMVNAAKEQGAEIVILPEMFNCPYDNGYFPVFAEAEPDGETIRKMAELAQSCRCYLVGGSIPEQDQGKIYNTSFVFDPNGRILGKHRKLHLFDIDLPGKIAFKESATFTAGDHFTIIDTDLGRLGIGICYDIRFPEYFRLMAESGIQMLFLPAAFNHITGPAHWETLLRARAIDNQIFVIAASPARNNSAGYLAYGHSMVVSPWGEVIWETGIEETVDVMEIDLERIVEVRQNMPLLNHRRKDLYRLEKISTK